MEKRKKAVVFIDGNNLYHNLKSSFINPSVINISKVSQLVSEHFNCELKKTIYYNSVPSIKDGEEIYYSHIKFLDEVRSYDNFEVKTRKLQRYSTKEEIEIRQKEISNLGLCKLCKPIVISHMTDYIGNISIKEKGIDILIAVDMIKLGIIEKVGDACILVSGDADFISCLDLLKAKGVWVATACTAKGYSYDLRNKFPWFILDKRLLIDKCSK